MTHAQTIAERVEEFICRQFPLARQRGIEHDTSLLEHGIIDSLGILEIVTFIESEFNTTLTDDEMLAGHFESIQSLSAFIMAKVNNEQPVSSDAP